jgi:hypothetical protein
VTVTTIALMVIVLLVGLRTSCYAYIDPNAGGFLVQILAPLGALAVSFLIYFRKQMSALLGKAKPPAAQPGDSVSSRPEP